MKPWDSARALQVCGQNHDKFYFGGTLYFRVCTLMELLPVLVGMGDTLGLCLMRDTFVKKMSDLVIFQFSL